jgi:hypothetical protein
MAVGVLSFEMDSRFPLSVICSTGAGVSQLVLLPVLVAESGSEASPTSVRGITPPSSPSHGGSPNNAGGGAGAVAAAETGLELTVETAVILLQPEDAEEPLRRAAAACAVPTTPQTRCSTTLDISLCGVAVRTLEPSASWPPRPVTAPPPPQPAILVERTDLHLHLQVLPLSRYRHDVQHLCSIPETCGSSVG